MELSCKVCMADTDLSVVTNYSLRRLWNWWVRVDDWSPVLCTWGLNNVVEADQYIPSGPTSIRSQTALRISFRNMPNFDRVFKIPSSKFIWWSMEAIFQSQQHPEIFWLCPNFSVLIWQLPTKYWLININDDPNPHSNPRQLEYVLLIAAGPGWPTWDRWDRLQPNHNPDGLMDGWTFRQSKKIIIHIFIIKIWFAILQSVELVYHVWWLSPQGLIWSVYMFLD